MAEPSIMVIDDDPYIRDCLSEILELRGFFVHRAGSGIVGLRYLQKLSEPERPALIILDQKMPSMRGSDFLLELLKVLPDFARVTRFFFFSAFPHFSVPMESGLKISTLDKLTELDSLIEMVEACLSRPAPRPIQARFKLR
jgi:DNA-binding NtrC family response regulator